MTGLEKEPVHSGTVKASIPVPVPLIENYVIIEFACIAGVSAECNLEWTYTARCCRTHNSCRGVVGDENAVAGCRTGELVIRDTQPDRMSAVSREHMSNDRVVAEDVIDAIVLQVEGVF